MLHRLSLGQVKLPIKESPHGELPGPGQAGPSLDASLKSQSGQGRAPVDVKLDYVFAGVAPGRLHPHRQTTIDELPLSRTQLAIVEAMALGRGRKATSKEPLRNR